jgi:uncharacterized protein with HEPN domain
MPLDAADHARLIDIQFYARRAIDHHGGLDLAAFAADAKTYDSVIRCLAVVGEAAWKLSKEFQTRHPGTPWILIPTMRHRLVHEYGAIDDETVYRVLTLHLPALIEQVDLIIQHEVKST